MTQAALHIEDLGVRFARGADVQEALRGVSLRVEGGEIVGVAGESGSGKSVTALSILRLLPPTAVLRAGRAELFGRPLIALSPTELQDMRGRDVAMIFQEPMTALNPVMTVGAQICDVILRHEDLSKAEARARAIALLDDMKVAEPARVFDSHPHELSGGLRQRAMIAMAFSCHPKLIIADEPTTALDVTVQAQILRLLRDRARTTGTAVLFISHDLAVIAQLCDRLYVMNRGAVVEEGAARDVIGHPRHPYTRALLEALPDGKPHRARLSVAPTRIVPPPSRPAAVPLLTLDNVTIRYPRARDLLGRPTAFHTAVDGVSFDLKGGETFSLVGESGSGKSSLAHAVVGLVPVSSGRIAYHGGRQDMQIVFQDPQGSLDPRWPAWRIITEPLTVKASLSAADLRAQADILCRRVGLDPATMERRPHAFSGGQRQRIAIARALSVSPRLVILDEPTSALDVSVQAQILDLLLDLQDEKGLAYLFISHNVSVVRHISDRVAVMQAGRIVEQGSAAAVLDAPGELYTRTLLAAVPTLFA